MHRRQRDQRHVVATDEPRKVGGRHVRSQVGDGPAVLGKDLLEADQPDHVLLARGTREHRQWTDAALGPELGADPLERAQQRSRCQVLLGDAPLARLPPLADEAHRIPQQAVEDLGPAGLLQGVLQGPARQLVVAIREETGEQLRRQGFRGNVSR